MNRRSVALIITLALLALVTLLVIAFLSSASLDRQATASYARSLQADSIALGGLDEIVSQLRAEITDPANSTTNSSDFTNNGTIYVPISGTNAVAQRMSPLPPVVTFSGTNVYGNAPNLAAVGSYTTNASANHRLVGMKHWYQPQLTLTTTGFPVPQWVLVTRGGTHPSAWAPSLADHALGNGNYVAGRYAYVVYDTCGLIDINVAGYPGSAAAAAADKGILPWIDLTQLTNTLHQADVDNLVAWRNAANASTYASYVGNWATNGFMRVAPGDTTFLSRQDLIKYAQTQNPALAGALPFLTTFSRELNGPTWGPQTNAGNNYNYQAQATNPGSFNPLIYNPRVQKGKTFTRANGTKAVEGEPLVKYRFPLDKLALLEKMQGTGTLSNDEIRQVQQYFGLDIASDVTAASGFYRHWTYPTTSTAYVHGVDSGATGIMSIDDVAKQGREPDFFELLQAGILQGSLGVASPNPVSTASARSDILAKAAGLNNLAITDVDQSKTYQILRIGANIIDQWHADNFPTTITYVPPSGSANAASVYGICDLPYINQLYILPYSTPANMVPGSAVPPGIYFCFQLWNPHQPSGATNTPTQFQVAPTSQDGCGIDYVAPGIHNNAIGAGFTYNVSNQTFGSGGAEYFNNNIVFTAAPSDYREPAVITDPISGGAQGQWAPANPAIGALQLTNLVFPPAGTWCNAGVTPALGYFPTDGISNALPITAHSPATRITWDQATNSVANYGPGCFNLPAATPIYSVTLRWNGVFCLQYLNPSDHQYHTYSSFEGMPDNPNLVTGYCLGRGTGGGATYDVITNTGTLGSANCPLNYAQIYAKSDPRTFRFGPGACNETTPPSNNTRNANPTQGITPANNVVYAQVNDSWPFVEGMKFNPLIPIPYRLDLWAVNDPAITTVKGPVGSTNTAYYSDPDGVYRYGDSHYTYNSGAGYATPLLSGATSNRPVILHRPFHSVGELGYVFRDDPWRTLDLFSPVSADAGLLDLFTLSDGQTIVRRDGQPTVVTAGRVSPNTPYPQVLAAMMAGATQNTSSGALLAPQDALAMANTLVGSSTNAPFVNRADLVARFMTNATFASSKADREAVIRSLAESSNTRTWNFLIDVVAQAGSYPSTAAASAAPLDSFVVGGERHYWMHVAIDRYTGQVIDRQLEQVSQ